MLSFLFRVLFHLSMSTDRQGDGKCLKIIRKVGKIVISPHSLDGR